MANWAELIPDLLTLIAKKVELYEDFVAFRGFCRSWRSAAAKNNFCPVQQQQVPWLLLAGDDDDSRDCYSLTKGGMVHSVYLPEAKGKRIFSSLGWLITIDIEGEMELLHPLSRSRIALPDASEFSHTGMAPINMLWRAALSASPSSFMDNDEYSLLIVIGVRRKLAYWRPGNDAWITIENPQFGPRMVEVVYCGSQCYSMNFEGELFSVDINKRTANRVGVGGTIPRHIFEPDHCYLVDSGGGQLIAVLRKVVYAYPDPDEKDEVRGYWTYSFRLFSFDSNYNYHSINDLGGERSLFVSRCAPVLVSGGGGSNIRPNCIYFTDDVHLKYYQFFNNKDIGEGGERDMRVYSLQQQKFIKDVTPLYHGNKGRNLVVPPFWVIPSF